MQNGRSPYTNSRDLRQQVEILNGRKPQACDVVRGYRGSRVKEVAVYVAGQKLSLPEREKRWLARRNSVEPIIGQIKSDEKNATVFVER